MDGKLRNMTSLYITHGDEILLLYRQGGRVADSTWVAAAGGHFEEKEVQDAGACVRRELEEELGITEKALKNMELRYITLRVTQGEIRKNYYFFAEWNGDEKRELSSNEGILKWFPLTQVQALKMPYTAGYVLEHYRETGIFNHTLYGGIADGKRVVFTPLPEF